MPKQMLLAFPLVFAMWIMCSAQQSKNNQLSQAQCEFSGGKSITVGYPSIHVTGQKTFRGVGTTEGTMFVTNEDLVTVKATNIPAGEYTFSLVPNSDKWTLIMKKFTGDSTNPHKYVSKELARVPMSVTRVPTSSERLTISFDHTGASCTMRVNWENTQASVDFSMKNTDLPVQD